MNYYDLHAYQAEYPDCESGEQTGLQGAQYGEHHYAAYVIEEVG